MNYGECTAGEPIRFHLRREGGGLNRVVWDPDFQKMVSPALPPLIPLPEDLELEELDDPFFKRLKKRVTAEEWTTFWLILDNVGVWDWQESFFPETEVPFFGGHQWYLDIETDKRSVSSRGEVEDNVPADWQLFDRASRAMAGQPCYDWRGHATIEDSLEKISRVSNLLPLGRNCPGSASSEIIVLLNQGVHLGYTLGKVVATIGDEASSLLPALKEFGSRCNDVNKWCCMDALKKLEQATKQGDRPAL